VDYAMGRNKMGAYQIKAVFFFRHHQGVNFRWIEMTRAMEINQCGIALN